MKTEQISFADILREKMSDSPSENKEKSPSSEPQLKNASPTEIHVKIDFETVFFTAKKYSRLASTTKFPSEKPPQKQSEPLRKAVNQESKEVFLPVSSLSKETFFALEMLKRLGAFELSSTEISLSQVKKAFRRLCVVYHPDRIPNGVSAATISELSLQFTQLKTAKDDLEEFFTLYSKSHSNKAA